MDKDGCMARIKVLVYMTHIVLQAPTHTTEVHIKLSGQNQPSRTDSNYYLSTYQHAQFAAASSAYVQKANPNIRNSGALLFVMKAEIIKQVAETHLIKVIIIPSFQIKSTFKSMAYHYKCHCKR